MRLKKLEDQLNIFKPKHESKEYFNKIFINIIFIFLFIVFLVFSQIVIISHSHMSSFCF